MSKSKHPSDLQYPEESHARVAMLPEESRSLVRQRLPELTNEQTEVVVEMILEAFAFGRHLQSKDSDYRSHEEVVELSRKGVEARRSRSRQGAIVEAFNAAASARRDVSIEQLAKEHGVSRATAYRALGGKPPTKSTAKRRK